MHIPLLVLLALVYFAPEVLSLIHGTKAAWEYVMYGLEAAVLWSFLFTLAQTFLTRITIAWAAFEAIQRPVCRLAFPMDAPPKLPEGQTLCDAAFGIPMSLVSVLCALLVASFAQEYQRAARRG